MMRGRRRDEAARIGGGGHVLRILAVGALVSAAAVGIGALVVWRSLIAMGLGILLSAIIGRWVSRPARGIRMQHRWVPFAWVVLFAVSNWKMTTGRTPLAVVSGSLSIENKVEIVAYLAVWVLAFSNLYLTRRDPRLLGIGALVAWPLFAVLSSAWSLIPLFTLVRSLQLFVPITLAVLMIRIWRADPVQGELLWHRSFRLIVQLITLAVLVGFVFISSWPEGRFTWPGSPHPIVSSGIVGFGFVVLIAGGRKLTGFSLPSYFLRILLFAAALLFGQTRSVLLGVAIASLMAIWLLGRDRPASRFLTIPLYLGSLFFVAILASSVVSAYVQRGQYGGLTTLNGRLPLWQLALRDVAARGRWLVGSGFGSTRVILFPQVSFAGEAHNSWVEFLIELGVIGLFLGVVAVVVLGYRLFRRRDRYSARFRAASAVFVYLLVLSQADNYLANLGFAFTAMALLFALTQGDGQSQTVPGLMAERSPPIWTEGRISAASRHRGHR
jgi:hypothetical protein